MYYMVLVANPLPRARSPGAFEGELRLCNILFDVAMEYSLEYIGDENYGSYMFFDLGPGVAREINDYLSGAGGRAMGMPRHLTADEERFVGTNAGAILFWSTDGFRDCEFIETDGGYSQRQREIEDDYDRFIRSDADADELNTGGLAPQPTTVRVGNRRVHVDL